MKLCAICSADIENEEAPPLLFIGKFGRHYEICPACERVMDKLVAKESTENERRASTEYLYKRLFESEYGKTRAEVVEFFKTVLSDRDIMARLDENRLQSLRDDTAEQTDADAEEDASSPATADDETVEESFEEESALSREAEKVSWKVKLGFLLSYLAVGGGALAYGIVRTSVFTIVTASLILLLGLASVFARD